MSLEEWKCNHYPLGMKEGARIIIVDFNTQDVNMDHEARELTDECHTKNINAIRNTFREEYVDHVTVDSSDYGNINNIIN